MEEYDNLSRKEILEELLDYKQRGFSWNNYGAYGEEIDINTPDHGYSDREIRTIVDGNFKLKFGDRLHIETLEVLDLYYLLNSINSSEDFLKSEEISVLDSIESKLPFS
tara:strand:- start:4663 stop:4989 length:327 start_codon:yes stop_codon:yes gene_type:complete